MILDDIITYKREEVPLKKKTVPLASLEQKIKSSKPTKVFSQSLVSDANVSLIAELKKASPSKGVIRDNFDPLPLAKKCVAAGASALSVLTDEKYFQGSLQYLEIVAAEIDVPLLRKDFIIDEYQIVEARAFGADAVLLMASVLDSVQLEEYIKLSHSYGMQCLVEVHTRKELGKVLELEPEIIGINNRNLDDFSIDIKTTEELIKAVPKGKIIVSESGIFTNDDILYLKNIGVNAVLVGESIMTVPDVEAKIKELMQNG